jgi:pimeloyl-ACP methyl ester carboxylesterase
MRGFAFLSVDKRGVGESDGTYELPDGGHDNLPHMTRRAGDVHAALAALGAREDIDAERIGLVGASQAGWVIPLAARHGGLAFTITLSGGATNLSIENVYSDWAKESDSGPELPEIGSVLERVRRYRPRDPDFREHFAAMDVPGLWLYGGKDRSNPSQLCKELIEDVAREHGRDFTVVLFPDGNHGLMQCRWGGAAERGGLRGMVPGLYSTIHDWLEKQGLGSS